MYKNIFLTGATGFVGTYVLEKLTASGFNVKALIRNKNKIKKYYNNCEYITGDVLNTNTFEQSLDGIDVIVNLIGIIREIKSRGITFDKLHVEATKNLLMMADKYGIKRFIQMSANGVSDNSKIKYYHTKYVAEELVRKSNTTYTIFRPSIIFGKGDGFITMLAKKMKILPFFINFGKGNFPFQVISVDDVATYFAESINNEATFNKTFCLCGDEIYTFKEIISLIQNEMQLKRMIIPVPVNLIKIITTLLGNLDSFPMTSDQLQMLLEGNVCNENCIDHIIKIKKIALTEKIADILEEV